jgi:iron complex transport system ATP-binding protein
VNPGHDLHAQGICVARRGNSILADVDISMSRGEVLGLLGPNGAGKSTLLSALAGVTAIDAGVITLDGQDLARMDTRQRARAIAYLPQDAPVHWPLTVADVVALGRLPHRGLAGNTVKVDAEVVDRVLAQTEMSDLRQRTLNTLSGGERMRALVARMLAVEAGMLLADEPVTGLDPYYQLEFMDLFVAQARAGCGVALVLHDLVLAARYCDRLVLLDEGGVVASGEPSEILSDAYLHSVYRVDAHRAAFGGQSYVIPWSRRL